LECVDCFCPVVFWYVFFCDFFHIFFARIATFRSSPLRSIPGLFNEICYIRLYGFFWDYCLMLSEWRKWVISSLKRVGHIRIYHRKSKPEVANSGNI
jgi:hypothetical protein